MMRSGNGVRRGSNLTADVCVVGGGAAGIAIAQKLAGTRLRVLLLESGGLQPDTATQDLYRGRSVGGPQHPLHEVRLRYFGGTTNHWAGWCAPLDASDFEEREWVPGSGWPISRATLDPYYESAHDVCDLGPWDYGEATWGRFAEPLANLEGSGTRLALLQHSKPTRFGEKFAPRLEAAENVQVLLGSNLTELLTTPGAQAVQRAVVETLTGNRFTVSSRYYIVACGAIENARLLLASNRFTKRGLGNDRDLVGRYFMDHPSARPGGVLSWVDGAARKLDQYTLVGGVRATLATGLDLEIQKRDRLTNAVVFAEGPVPAETVEREWPADRAAARFLLGLGGQTGDAPVSEWWVRCEQAPNPDSRVSLSDERDALGMRRPVLDWRLKELDLHTVARVSRLYAEILTRAGAARVKVAPWLLDGRAEDFARIPGDWHQIGTTRMADGPESGVVDADCKVFGLANLFVAGASVFPTTGAMNPTLTLVALALRLADHVKKLAS